eukprot:TRINITY_DN21431_c0_g1_i3.p1 TRINITY_DN21431_c0_g1~~TRINITY_DN21431_c0_g1_i3.p1  ORF type:complete len:221 (+),score=32.62 TRINITY_DN21431_c0_g1_i3:131-793(+)
MWPIAFSHRFVSFFFPHCTQLGLAQYVPLFEQHGIAGYQLMRLTERELRKMGIAVGHKHVILEQLHPLKIAAWKKRKDTIVYEFEDFQDSIILTLGAITCGICGPNTRRKVVLTNSALRVETYFVGLCPLCCAENLGKRENVDLSKVVDVNYAQDYACLCCLERGYVNVKSTDPSLGISAWFVTETPPQAKEVMEHMIFAVEANQMGAYDKVDAQNEKAN